MRGPHVRSITTLFLSLACACETGCASRATFSPLRQVPAGQAVVYIYRLPNVARYSSVPLCAETTLVEVFGRTYFPYVADPGMAFFQPLTWTARPKAVLPVRLSAGGTYYLRVNGPADLSLVSPAIAREEIADCERTTTVNDTYRMDRQQWLRLKKGMHYEEVLDLLRATGADMGTAQRTAAPEGTSRFIMKGRMWPANIDAAGATQWTVVFENRKLAEWTELPVHPCDKGARPAPDN